MKQLKTSKKVDKKEEEKCEAMNNADLILRCIDAGVLTPAAAGEYMKDIFEKLGIKKGE